MSGKKFKFDAVSHVGAVRTNNEDMAYVFGAKIRDDASRSMVETGKDTRFAAVIADGMGGYGGGEVASEMTIDSFDRFLLSLGEGLDTLDVIMAVKQWGKEINSSIMAAAATNLELNNMGTTFSGFFTYDNRVFLLNAGDSRVYRFRDGNLYQLSTDHSERQRLNDSTLPSNLIYNALGIPDAFIDVTEFDTKWPMVDGDIYLVCSDGLSDMISDDEISAILENHGNANALVEAAIEAGGRDNCTVILVQFSATEDEATVQESVINESENNEQETMGNEQLPPLPVVDDFPMMEPLLPPPAPPMPPIPPVPSKDKNSGTKETFYDEDGKPIAPPLPSQIGSENEPVGKPSLLQRCKNAINAFRANPNPPHQD